MTWRAFDMANVYIFLTQQLYSTHRDGIKEQKKIRYEVKYLQFRLPPRRPLIPQHPPQNLPRRIPWHLLNELDAAPQLLMCCKLRLHHPVDLLYCDGARPCFADHEGAGYLVARNVRVRNADDGSVEDLLVPDQDGLELGGRDLKALVLDQFLRKGG